MSPRAAYATTSLLLWIAGAAFFCFLATGCRSQRPPDAPPISLPALAETPATSNQQPAPRPDLLSQGSGAPITPESPARSNYKPGLVGSILYKLDAASYAKATNAAKGTPGKLKNSTYAVGNTAPVVNAPKADAPVSGTGPAVDNRKAKAPTSTQVGDGNTTTQTDIEKNKAPAATAPNATATSTESSGLSWWWLLPVVLGAGWFIYKRWIA